MNMENFSRESFFKRTRIFTTTVFVLIWLLAPIRSSSGQDDVLKIQQRPEGRSPLPITPGCERFIGQASPEEIATTPRQFSDLERLAIRMSNTFTANPAIYSRVVSDVAGIRSSYPKLNYPYRGENDAKGIALEVDDPAFRQMKSGTYRAWECPNGFYGLVKMNFYATVDGWVFLSFKGIYNTDLLALEYSRLPGVKRVQTNRLMGGGRDICGTIEGAQYHYVFDLASGDCPAGCANHKYFYFVSSPMESPRFIAEREPRRGPAPDWLRRYGHCYRFP